MPARRAVEYPQWLASNITARGEKYRAGAAPGMFSFLTTVYETKGRYVLELYESVKRQTVGEFEWILLDNGSTKADTLAAIEQVRQDPRVVYMRVEENLGILGGISMCLQRATGRYVVPLDSDDLMTPDALAILRHYILAGGGGADGGEGRGPALLFTDEDKCRETPAPFEAYHKPEWDPVLFWNSCYIAHLCAVRRDLATQLGVYTDDNARGCHDWDTFFRFYVAGHDPVHVPEVTYSWRQHPQSCAGNIFSKSYIHESHQHVLTRNLERTAGTRLFELTQSPLFAETPDWWVKRRRIEPQRLVALYVHREDASVPAWLRDHELVDAVAVVHADQLSQAKRALAELGDDQLGDHQPGRDDLVLVVGEGTEPAGDEWPWEVMAMFERFADTSVVGGRLLDEQGILWSAGEVAGFGGIVGTPDRGRQSLDPGYFAWLRKQRSVTAVHPAFCVVRAGFLTDGIALDPEMSFQMLGAWLGALAREQKQRVAFSPVIEASIAVAMMPSEAVPGVEARRFFARFPTFVDRDDYYPRHLGLEPSSAFAAVHDDERRDALNRLRKAYLVDAPAKSSARGQQVVA